MVRTQEKGPEKERIWEPWPETTYHSMSLDETAPLTSLCWPTTFITVPTNREGSQITSPSGMSELVLCYWADVGLLVSWGLQREHPRPLALIGE